jgi:CspA family cold shock protein
MRIEGIVRRWTDKGYGFVKADDGQEYFAHIRSVREYDHDDLLEGTRIEFDVGPSRRHPGKFDAVDIKVLSEP